MSSSFREPANSSYITITQHNAGKRDVAHHTILQQAFERKTDVLLLQEPFCPRNYATGGFIGITHPAYYLITLQPTTSPSNITLKPRVLAYVRKGSLAFTPRYDLCNDPDLQVIQVFGIEPFYIFNVYNERERIIGSSEGSKVRLGLYTVERLLQHIHPDFPSVILGDFNLHHPWWNSAVSSSRANRASCLVGWLESCRATLLNNPSAGGTLLRAGLQQESVIDLTFYTPF
jgi:hypothetical protein